MPVFLNDIERTTHIPVRHSALRDDLQVDNVDTCLAIPNDMNMCRFVIGGVDDETQSMLTQKRNNGPN